MIWTIHLQGIMELSRQSSGKIPSREVTYPPNNGTFEDDFPVPEVGYVSSLEGTHTRHFQLLPLPGQSGSPQWRR